MRRLFRVAAMALAVCAGVGGLAAAQPPAAPEAQGEQVERIDLNRASAVELETLPGVGPRTAELIIAYRNENGGFKKIEDLMNVRGIGERSFLRLRPLVSVGEAEAASNAGGRQ